MSQDYYKILNINKNSSESEIKKAYHRKARETHPDKHGANHSDEEFKLVAEAYQILIDPMKRRDYDNGCLNVDGRTFFKSPEDIYMEVYGDEERSMEEFYKSDNPFKMFFHDAEFRYKNNNPFTNHL